MKFKIGHPVIGMTGTTSNSQLSFTTVDGEVRARAKSPQSDKRTTEQLRMRAYMSEVSAFWDELTGQQQDMWETYTLYHLTPRPRPNSSVGRTGFITANINRKIMGLPLITNAPLLGPPQPVGFLQQVQGTGADTLVMTLHHQYQDTTGLVVLARMSRAAGRRARTPQLSDLRYVCGAQPESSAPLPPSGSTVTFAPTRFAAIPGQRYGVQVRVVRAADGIPSPPVHGDFVKQ